MAFVGSTRVARLVHERGVAAGKRVLALGGAKNHLVVMPDADVELTAKNVVASVTGCAGQRVHGGERADHGGGLCAGDGGDRGGDAACGAWREHGGDHQRSGQGADRGVYRAGGGEWSAGGAGWAGGLCGGQGGGLLCGADDLDGVSAGDECACDEIFGPVLTVLRVGSLDDAIAIENASPYGNAASIYTADGGTARYFEERASSGMIGVNIGVPVPREPFSFGGWNDSRFGAGDITGEDGVRFWTKMKKVTVKWSEVAGRNWMS